MTVFYTWTMCIPTLAIIKKSKVCIIKLEMPKHWRSFFITKKDSKTLKFISLKVKKKLCKTCLWYCLACHCVLDTLFLTSLHFTKWCFPFWKSCFSYSEICKNVQCVFSGVLCGAGDVIAQFCIEKKKLKEFDWIRNGRFMILGFVYIVSSLVFTSIPYCLFCVRKYVYVVCC